MLVFRRDVAMNLSSALTSISESNARANMAAASTGLGRAIARLSRRGMNTAADGDPRKNGRNGRTRDANAAELPATLSRYRIVTRSGLAALAERN
jgi:hypothetical protein